MRNEGGDSGDVGKNSASVESENADGSSGGMLKSLSLRSSQSSPAQASWGTVIPLPIVPVSAASLPNGKVLFWAANDRFSFGAGGQSYTARFDPVSGTATEKLVNQTGQDLFCPGTATLSDGRVLVNGGTDSSKTSIYNPATDSWSAAAQMNIRRGYNASTLLQDGSV